MKRTQRKTTKKCKTTKRKTKGGSLNEIIGAMEKRGKDKIKIKVNGKEIELNLNDKKKESKWKKAGKIALGVGALAGAGALGYYGYKNRDELMKAVKKYYRQGKQQASNIYSTTKNKASGIYNDTSNWLSNKYNDTSEWMGNKYNDTLDWMSSKYNDASKWLGSKYSSFKNRSIINNLNEIKDNIISMNENTPKSDTIDHNTMSDVLSDYYKALIQRDPFKAKEMEPVINDTLNNTTDLELDGDKSSFWVKRSDLLNNLDTLIARYHQILH